MCETARQSTEENAPDTDLENEDLKNLNAQTTKVKSHKLDDSKLKLFHISKEDTAKWTDNLGDRMR